MEAFSLESCGIIMREQKGQSVVEMAIILPMFFTLVLAVFYVGIMFMDYIQFSNAARAAARDIALINDETKRLDIENKLKAQDEDTISKYATQLTNLYIPEFTAEEDTVNKNITVTITFKRNDKNFPTLLYYMNFPPSTLGSITYTMPMEPIEPIE